MRDDANIEVYTHIKITDPDTGKVFLNKRVDQPKKENRKNDGKLERKNNRPLNNQK